MKKIDDGGPAFPVDYQSTTISSSVSRPMHGMSLRDWFAGQALSGLLGGDGTAGAHWSAYAMDAYAMADAMLETRKESNTEKA